MGTSKYLSPELIGKRFGRLTVTCARRGSLGHVFFVGVCDCGATKETRASHVISGRARSCGCLMMEVNSASKPYATTHGHTSLAEGRRTSTYTTWEAMRRRCIDEKHDNFANYGGRGIKVCDRWLMFENFLADMGERPFGKTIDRREADGDYEPGNCFWATAKEQNRRRRAGKLNAEKVKEIRALREAGETMRSIAARYGVNSSTVSDVVHHKIWA